jgi:hypothetical protein
MRGLHENRDDHAARIERQRAEARLTPLGRVIVAVLVVVLLAVALL